MSLCEAASSVYTAIYSGTPVYEVLVGDIAVMRRMSDSFLNATQILKLAGFSKAKRTRILEKEIMPFHHEKIQGGYGKYQGTWVPPDSARALATRYGVSESLSSLFDFDPVNGKVVII
jgi:hypothetical protein